MEMKKRWDTLDILKCLCAFGVISIHRAFLGQAGEYVKLFGRIAVPVFFMITGFFYRDTLEKGKEKAQIWKIFKLMVMANLFYCAWGIFLNLVRGRASVLQTLMKFFTWENVRNFFLTNESPFKGHLWYLGAALYVLVLAAYCAKKGRMKWLAALTPLLLAGDLVFGKYSVLLWNRKIPYIYVRNYLFTGIPYFCIGYVMGCHREKLAAFFGGWKMLLTAAGAGLFFRTTLLEKEFLLELGKNARREHYISTTFLAVCVFLFFLGWAGHYKGGWLTGAGAKIGRKYSALLYIVHPAVATSFTLALKGRTGPVVRAYESAAPVWVFLVTLVLVVAWSLAAGGIKALFSGKKASAA